MPGITREIILELAPQSGIKALVADIPFAELLAADEVFLTNSLVEIMPVTRINGKKLNLGQHRPITQKLMKSYKELLHKEIFNQNSSEGRSQK